MVTPMEMGYKLVSERHAKFVEDHPNGSVYTNLEYVRHRDDGTGFIVMSCTIWKNKDDRDAGKAADGVGHASMPIPGPTSFTRNSEVENAETSALGRALAMIGYHPKESMASDDEIAMKAAEKLKTASFTEKDGEKATGAQVAKFSSWVSKVFPETKDQRKFMLDVTGKRKRSDLTRGDITKLFDGLKDIESILDTAGGLLDGVSTDE